MNLLILGRRYFKNFKPDSLDLDPIFKSQHRIFQFPKHRPYSWTLRPLKYYPLDWK